MVNFLDRHFGRLGNRMFQMAALYAHARDSGLDFYFQDPKFFAKYDREIKSMFGEDIGYDDRVSLHLRLGKNPSIPTEPNYNENSFYFNLPASNYYELAVELFPNDRFLVFTDNISAAVDLMSRKFGGQLHRFDYSDGHSEIEDLKLMASCKHNIIANSTFSWWAAYLNPNPKKIIITPKQWFADGVVRTVCPADWKQL